MTSIDYICPFCDKEIIDTNIDAFICDGCPVGYRVSYPNCENVGEYYTLIFDRMYYRIYSSKNYSQIITFPLQNAYTPEEIFQSQFKIPIIKTMKQLDTILLLK